MIVNKLFLINKQDIILIEEIQEHRSGDSFIPIEETMILGHKVEKIRCFFLQTRIDLFPCKRLINIPYTAFKRIILFTTEKIRFFSKVHIVNYLSALFICQTVCGGISLWTLQCLMIISIQKVQCRTVSFNYSKYLFGVQRVFGSFQQLYYTAEIIEPFLINCIPLQNILFQYFVCPASKFHAAL